MADYRLAAAIERRNGEEFLLVRQSPPPVLEEEYQRFVDSDLWDLPSSPLKVLEGERRSEVTVKGGEIVQDKLDLKAVDVESALDQVASQLGRVRAMIRNLSVLKIVEEPEFGPGFPIHTLFIVGTLADDDGDFPGSCKWISKTTAANLLVEATPISGRVGPFAAIGLLQDSYGSKKWQLPHVLHYQEYPPGIMVVPMRSRTQKPFHTTNLVVLLSEGDFDEYDDSCIIGHADALLVDPGCSTQCHSELADLVTSLPRKLFVFLTHHHYDHTDGLSVVQKCNPDATLLAHENTFNRIDKGNWSHGYVAISGGEKIQIGGHILEAIFATGHTDGHIALLHLNSNSLIVGDHCVGHGSAVLDISSGGNMKDYFHTTYNFLKLSPHVLIPMHGRINLWPERMLCGYLKHRRDRELSILKAIENGAESLYDIVATVYADVDSSLWFAASSNVRLHVDHLAYQEKLPKGFSLEEFNNSYDAFIRTIGIRDSEKYRSQI